MSKKQRIWLTAEMKEFIIKEKNENNQSVRRIVENLSAKFGVETSKSAVQRTIKNRNRKKTVHGLGCSRSVTLCRVWGTFIHQNEALGELN